VETTEVQKLTALEDTHWWYKERRALLDRELRRLPGSGLALDIGAAGGGNTRVLRARGWQAVAADYSEKAVEVAHARGLTTLRIDARKLPLRSQTCDLVTAFDVLEHIDEDYLVMAEIARVLKPGAVALIAVPCDMALWSAHDEAVGHVRRYSKATLAEVVRQADLDIDSMWSWNVLLRPALALRRRSATGSDLDVVPPLVNRVLTSIVVAERYLPVKSLPGSSLMLRAHLAAPDRSEGSAGRPERDG
jgi:SAM-dependent methyltransferase